VSDVRDADAGVSSAQNDLWIFRDGSKLVSGKEMVRDLERRVSAGNNGSALLDSLIEAGELEAALADANCAEAPIAAQITDILAWAVCSGQDSSPALQFIAQIHPPDQIAFSSPEGFTYYALHPLDFAQITSRISEEPKACALVGIRSIGTTLSAMCAAGLRSAGRPVSRITVRPTGHPYARRTEFSSPQLHWIGEQLAIDAQFLVVDEGPGRSGSTFLSVAEALQRAGVPNGRITILGSRQPNPAELCAEDAIARWKSFHFVSTMPSVNKRFEGYTYLGGGAWRHVVFQNFQDWPESWTQMERLKFLSPDRQALYKFEGMGPLGIEVRDRACVLADAGFSPRAAEAGGGFVQYQWLDGHVMNAKDLTSTVLDRLAEYCAFRASQFCTRRNSTNELHHMLEHNVRQEFGAELNLDADIFAAHNPVLADGRMQPYEWITTDAGEVIKTDAVSHGDDHFFPGPCDIVWDLAGVAIEWQLDGNGCEYLLNRFQALTARDAKPQMLPYMLTYSIFRLGFCKMAISTVLGSTEESRLRSAYAHYRGIAKGLLARLSCHAALRAPAA